MATDNVVDDIVRAGFGFTDHACDRFIERAGVTLQRGDARRELLRLTASSGFVHAQHPGWAGAGLRGFPAYLVIDGWVLCGLEAPDADHRDWRVITLVTLHDYTWQQALDAGIASQRPASHHAHRFGCASSSTHGSSTADFRRDYDRSSGPENPFGQWPGNEAPRRQTTQPVKTWRASAPRRAPQPVALAWRAAVISSLAGALGAYIGVYDAQDFTRNAATLAVVGALLGVVVLAIHLVLGWSKRLIAVAALVCAVCAAACAPLGIAPDDTVLNVFGVGWWCSLLPLAFARLGVRVGAIVTAPIAIAINVAAIAIAVTQGI